MVLDKATGELVERSTYQAYGGSESDYRPERWKSFREDYRFTGKEEDVEVGLIYFGYRFLNPLLNRWVSADPLTVHGLGADPNLYAYVSGRVLQSVDPLGLEDTKEQIQDSTQASGGWTDDPNAALDVRSDPESSEFWLKRSEPVQPLGYTDSSGTLQISLPGMTVGGDASEAQEKAALEQRAATNGMSPAGQAFYEHTPGVIQKRDLKGFGRGTWNGLVDVADSSTGVLQAVASFEPLKVEIPKGQDSGALLGEAIGPQIVLGVATLGVAARFGARTSAVARFEDLSPGNKCFAAGTLVAMADGGTKPIEMLQPGDIVLSMDDNGRALNAPVTHTFENYSESGVVVEVLGPDEQTARFDSTGEHPFFTVNRGWTHARELRKGDVLIGPSGQRSVVGAVTALSRTFATFNIAVANVHTYFVVDGNAIVLVHNMSPLEAHIRGQAPVAIPKDAVFHQARITGSTGAWNFSWRWASGGLRYTARFHSPSPGAVSAGDTRNVWVIQRGTGYGNPTQALSETGAWTSYGAHATGQTGTSTHLSSKIGVKIRPCP